MTASGYTWVVGPNRVLRPGSSHYHGSRFFGMPIVDIIYVLKTIKINLLIAEVSRKKRRRNSLERNQHSNRLRTILKNNGGYRENPRQKFKLLAVINRDYEATLWACETLWVCEKKRIHSKSKKYFKGFRVNIWFEDQGYRTQGCSRWKARRHWWLGPRDAEQDTCIWNDHQNARIPNAKIKAREHREAQDRGWIDSKEKGQQRSGKFINHQSKTTFTHCHKVQWNSYRLDQILEPFEGDIDKGNLPSMSKFSYLKETLEPKVHLLVDVLPFDTEG